jgi:hypothetical protein
MRLGALSGLVEYRRSFVDHADGESAPRIVSLVRQFVRGRVVLELERSLAAKLARMNVRIQIPDANTVVFHTVPTNCRFFNKTHTNLLFKRPRAGMPFLACVDEDIEYRGPKGPLDEVFGAGARREGWRALCLESAVQTDLQRAAANALAALGFDGREPGLAAPPPGDEPLVLGELLTAVGTNLSQRVSDPQLEPTVGRADQIDEVTSGTLRSGQARLVVIVGESGVGKTNLLHAVARRLAERRLGLSLVMVDLGAAMAGTPVDPERENLLSALLDEAAASRGVVLALEHFELALYLLHGPMLLANALDNGARIIGSALPGDLDRRDLPSLSRRLNVVELPELSPGETVCVLQTVGPRLARGHGIEIADSCIGACVRAALQVQGRLPAKAIALLDDAIARAALNETAMVGPDDIYFAASLRTRTPSGDDVGS